MTKVDSFGARGNLKVGGDNYQIYRLSSLGDIAGINRLPYSIKILLENLIRHEDGQFVTSDDVASLAQWPGQRQEESVVSFTPERVLLQDFTGVPAVVDLAALRDALFDLGGDPALVSPKVPVELVIDHSVIAEVSGRSDSFGINAKIEYQRNVERYRLLRWAQQAFDQFLVVPPDTGICHQVNLEYLARVIFATDHGEAFPDTLVGTDSHTTMVNGLGVLGWGVGGIEAEAGMLGQPLPMPTPAVVGVELLGELGPTVTATDLVLTMAELLRRHGVVGKFVEFTGPGLHSLRAEHRATLGNMAPEYGATCAISPIDEVTLDYLRLTGRSDKHINLVEHYAKEQGLFYQPGNELPLFSEMVRLDLSKIEPSISGPSRPQDRIPLSKARRSFRSSLGNLEPEAVKVSGQVISGAPVGILDGSPEEASAESFPASDPPSEMAGLSGSGKPDPLLQTEPAQSESTPELGRISRPVTSEVKGQTVEIDDGHVVIAAITSCTNTSNPQVMLGAGLLAKRAVGLGLRSRPWVKTSLAPGSRVVTEYLKKADLARPLAQLGFDLVGYGCTTCIGNSGPLLEGVSEAIAKGNLATCAVLSGNRNFEGRIHPEVRMNYLASPPLVVAYALAGTMDIDIMTEPLGYGGNGEPITLKDLWPTTSEINKVIDQVLGREQFTSSYSTLLDGDEQWGLLEAGTGLRFDWQPNSTYVQKPPFFDAVTTDVPQLTDVRGARVLALLGNSITTDHISPAGSISPSGPAGKYLIEKGVQPKDFNSFGARRGNHEVMWRGTFANVRLRNTLVPGTEGGFTRYLPTGEQLSIFEAAEKYRQADIPLVILAGKEYGSGSSRDWAAKGTMLLGVRAVIAESYERIHLSNLVGMGVLPLQFEDGASVESLGLSGEETFAIIGIASIFDSGDDELQVLADGRKLPVRPRIETPSEREHFRHGGVLPFVLRELAAKSSPASS